MYGGQKMSQIYLEARIIAILLNMFVSLTAKSLRPNGHHTSGEPKYLSKLIYDSK